MEIPCRVIGPIKRNGRIGFVKRFGDPYTPKQAIVGEEVVIWARGFYRIAVVRRRTSRYVECEYITPGAIYLIYRRGKAIPIHRRRIREFWPVSRFSSILKGKGQ